jgi:hypothetical protein
VHAVKATSRQSISRTTFLFSFDCYQLFSLSSFFFDPAWPPSFFYTSESIADEVVEEEEEGQIRWLDWVRLVLIEF